LRLAVISDIHGNLEAFQKVLEDIHGCYIDYVICLGDMIGYGPDPEGVVQLIRGKNIPTVMGNHELALLEPRYLERFNPLSQLSLFKTKNLLTHEAIHFIRSLENQLTLGDSLFVHGAPPDSVMTYLFELSNEDINTLFLTRAETKFFVGHTHDLILIGIGVNGLYSRPLTQEILPFKTGQKYLVNVGSVGQPRDGNNQAKYVIWDQEAESLEVRFISYDIERTVHKIQALGLPEYHARRLW
jgi:predicted phosphodiesterase